MILRQTIISECWCAKCHEGQMQTIQQLLFDEKISLNNLIGKDVECAKCGHKNIIEDVVILQPVEFFVSAESMKSTGKSNDDMYRWLTS